MQSTINSRLTAFLRNQKSKRILWCYIIAGIFAPFIAGNKPLLFINKGGIHFPAFSSSAYVELQPEEKPVLANSVDWRSMNATLCILPPVCYSPNELDPHNANFASPFGTQWQQLTNGELAPLTWRHRHWLGTTRTGQDVLSILIHGCRTSLLIGFGAVGLAALIALLFGLFAGYYGNEKLHYRRTNLLLGIIIFTLSIFYSIQLSNAFQLSSTSQWLLFAFIISFLILLARKMLSIFSRSSTSKVKLAAFPADKLLTAITAGFISLPRLLILLSLAALWETSITGLLLIIGLTSWAEAARVIRTEMLRMRSLPFMQHAQQSGASDIKIILHHALPNLSATIRVLFLTGIATAILSEAGLTFLGIGLPFDTPSWGALLFEAKRNLQAWWLVLFPGLVIFTLTRVLFTLSKK